MGPSAPASSLSEQVSLSFIAGNNQRQPRTWWVNPPSMAGGQLFLDLSGKLWGPNLGTFLRAPGLHATSNSLPQQLAQTEAVSVDRQDAWLDQRLDEFFCRDMPCSLCPQICKSTRAPCSLSEKPLSEATSATVA